LFFLKVLKVGFVPGSQIARTDFEIRLLQPTQLKLLTVKLNDKLLVDISFDILTRRDRSDRNAQVLAGRRDPRRTPRPAAVCHAPSTCGFLVDFSFTVTTSPTFTWNEGMLTFRSVDENMAVIYQAGGPDGVMSKT
jgi:hypothetical protein